VTAAEELMSDMISEEEMASLLKKKIETLRNDRYKGLNHPPYVKFGRTVFYPRHDFQLWLKEQVIRQKS
jgi:hypothetical protein